MKKSYHSSAEPTAEASRTLLSLLSKAVPPAVVFWYGASCVRR